MKRQTFNVLFFIRKTRTVKSGETSIMLRITIQGQLAEMQLKRTVKPEHLVTDSQGNVGIRKARQNTKVGTIH